MLDFFTELARDAMEAVNQGDFAALLALFLISTLTEIGIPFPFILDTVLILTGIQRGVLSIEVLFIMIALMLGRIAGASIIYWLTVAVGGKFLDWLSKRFPFLPKRIDQLTARLSRRAPLAIAIARLTPGLLTPSTVAAGIMRIRYVYLIAGIIISSLIADGVLIILGFSAGRGLERLGFHLSVWIIIVIVVLIMGIGWLIGSMLSKRNHK